MCGICGYLHTDGRPVDERLGGRMTDMLRHRGPDGSGTVVVQPDDAGSGPTLFLGHRRLKIIDLSEAARQPIANEDRSVWAMFNGEIYRFQALRAELERCGHRFRSHADSETIVHAYEEYGDEFVRHLDGMFALALWDKHRRRLVIARDRSGKKPLYHAWDGRTFTFGSEIKALLPCPWVASEIATEHLDEYLAFGCVHAPATMFRGIHSLPPGTMLAIENGRPGTPTVYWDLKDAMVPRAAAPSPAEAGARVRELLTSAVETRLVSEVPLGALLSGGLDSTIVVGIMSRLREEPVRTFAVGFADDPSYDERAHAAVAARAFGTDHTEFVVRADASSLIQRLLWHHDQPYGDSSAVPTYLISKIARQHVTVALTGDGGDEVFGGYERFRAALMAERIPGFVEDLARTMARALPRDDGYYGLRRRIERFVARSGAPPIERYLDWVSVFDRDSRGALLRPEVAHASAPNAVQELAAGDGPGDGASLLDRLLYLNFTTYLPDDLHVKVDRMSMAHGLETRAPLLDTRLVEYVAGLPSEFKVRGSRLKVVLRDAFRDLVPAELRDRRKHGFGAPVERWFAGELGGIAGDLLRAPDSRIRRWLDPSGIGNLLDEHTSGRRAHGHRLWTLVNLELWCRMIEDGGLKRHFADDPVDIVFTQGIAGRS